VSVVTLTLVLAIAAVLLYTVDSSGQAIAVSVGGWPIPFGIVLYVDRLAALLVVISSIVLLAVLLFSVGQGAADGDDDTPVTIFHPRTSSCRRASSTRSSRATSSTCTSASRSCWSPRTCSSRSAPRSRASAPGSSTSSSRSSPRSSSSPPSPPSTARWAP
jgi:hypothetical protein